MAKCEADATLLSQNQATELQQYQLELKTKKEDADAIEDRVQKLSSERIPWIKQKHPEWRAFLESARHIPDVPQYLAQIPPLPGNI